MRSLCGDIEWPQREAIPAPVFIPCETKEQLPLGVEIPSWTPGQEELWGGWSWQGWWGKTEPGLQCQRTVQWEGPQRTQQHTPRTGCPWAFSTQRALRARWLTGVAALTTRDHQSPCQMGRQVPSHFPPREARTQNRTEERGMMADDIAISHPQNTIQRHSSGRREFWIRCEVVFLSANRIESLIPEWDMFNNQK